MERNYLDQLTQLLSLTNTYSENDKKFRKDVTNRISEFLDQKDIEDILFTEEDMISFAQHCMINEDCPCEIDEETIMDWEDCIEVLEDFEDEKVDKVKD